MNESKNSLKFWVAASVVIFLLLGWLSRSSYRHYKEKHFLTESETFFAGGDYRNSLLCARQTLQIDPSNAPACRIMAGSGRPLAVWIGDGGSSKFNPPSKTSCFWLPPVCSTKVRRFR
jgi:hypothetical protein